jgi:hypothetical protein
MSLDRDLHIAQHEDRELLNQPVTSSSVSFVVPLALLIAAAMLGWIFYGSLSPTIDNTGSTTPVMQTDLPQSRPATPNTP